MVKYQFFVGSTYKDLVDERQVAINAIIETNNIVAGMEFFGAVGENQLEHIKQEIDQTDYYLLIICPWAKMRSNRLYKKLSLIKKTASYGVSF